MGIQICQAETVYRYLDIDRHEAIRIFTEEVDLPAEDLDARVNDDEGIGLYLATLSDQQLCDLLQKHIDDRDAVYSYMEAEVCEVDSSEEWTVEVTASIRAGG